MLLTLNNFNTLLTDLKAWWRKLSTKVMHFALTCSKRTSKTGLKVAVVGAGVCGLIAAGYIACAGHEVDVYDKQPMPGGSLVFAVPPWRIPRESVLEGAKELEERLGVKFFLKTKVFSGVNLSEEGDEFVEKVLPLEDLVGSYDAVLIASGAWRTRRPEIPGLNSVNVYSALSYLYYRRLQEMNLINKGVSIGRRVVVYGGSISALAAAGQALSDGAEVYVIYEDSFKRASIDPVDLKKLEDEGVVAIDLARIAEVSVINSVVTEVKFQRLQLSSINEGRVATPIPNSYFTLSVDSLLLAGVEEPSPPLSSDVASVMKIAVGPKTILVDEWGRTTNKKVFAAGSVITGLTTIGDAVRQGVRTAREIDRWLKALTIKLK
ncbi:MAG: FAD-dependent oxidoreductase [Sulfolobales archaeon]|nr:FAD-dependent oxidoreductase [Sulfolobales archaeon]